MKTLVLLLLLFSVSWAKENLFAPPDVVIKKPAEEKKVLSNNPLQKYSLYAYKITGIVYSNGFRKAIVVTPDKKTFFVGVGDYLGNRGEVIVGIEPDKILLRLGDKLIVRSIEQKKGG